MFPSMNRIGPIQLFAEIKQRPHGVTYRGVDQESGQIVFVKTFQPATALDETAVARFHQEAAIYASLNHPNVVKLVKFGVAERRLYLALEFIEGQNLRAFLAQRSPLPNDIAICITLSLLAGLEEIHWHGIIHRDLKPENIMIGHDCTVKICDFDLAITRGRDPLLKTFEGKSELFGSAGYFSPEAILGEPVTPRSDLFAAGVVLYEMFAGTRPFVAPTASGEMNAIIRLPHLTPSKFNAAIPPEIEQVINRLLAKSPAERPENATVILNELKAKFALPENAQKKQTLQRFLANPAQYQSAEFARPLPTPATAIRRSALLWRIAAMFAIIATTAVIAYQNFFTRVDESLQNQLAASLKPATLSRADSLLRELRRVTFFDSAASRPEGSKMEDGKTAKSAVPVAATAIATSAQKHFQRTLFVRNTPWAYLFVNGDSIGQMPAAEPLRFKEGVYQFVFKKPLFPEIFYNVVVDSTSADTLFFSLWERVAQLELKVHPWAEVFIDGVKKELAAESPVIYLLPGEHRFKFVHLQREKNEMIFLRAGEQRRLEVNMFQQAKRE